MVPDRAPPVVLVGLDSLQGLQVARILARRGIPVVGVAKDRDYYSCRTRVCKSITYTNTASIALIDTLEELAEGFEEKPALIACQDKNVMVISEHRHRLEDIYHFVLPDHGIVETLIDKARFAVLASELGLKIPKTIVIQERTDAEKAAATLRYPSVIKPHFRSSDWSKHTKTKAVAVDSSEELLEAYEHIKEWSETLIAQERIQGGDDTNYTCNVYFDRDSNLLASFVSRKIRQWPPGLGQGCSSVEVRDDEVLAATSLLYQALDFRGFGYLELKRDPTTGDLYAVEPNVGRPTGRSAIAEGGGVEFHYTAYCDALGLPLPVERTQRETGVRWFHEFRDLQAALHYWRGGVLSAGEWMRTLRGKRVYAIFSWRDPLPFLAALRRALPMMMSRRERGRGDYQGSDR